MFNEINREFPAIANSEVVYLDSASSCQVPSVVIKAISDYLEQGHGNPHRGMYSFAEKADCALDECRQRIAKRINANKEQIALTKSTTESINMVASYFESRLSSGQTILLTEMEHHANLLPWQRLSEKLDLKLEYIPITHSAELDLNALEHKLKNNCGLLAITHISNLFGTENPIKQIIQTAQQFAVPTLVDGAQAVAHGSVDVDELGCDYYVFSSHKLYGPTGLGALYLKEPDTMEPFILGGGIVSKVTNFNHKLTSQISRLEAGSPNMVSIVGTNAALKFLDRWSISDIKKHELGLANSLREAIQLQGYIPISHAQSANIVSFIHPEIHSHDIATILADSKIAVRAGHHCAQPGLNAVGLKQCVRASVAIYNSNSDIEKFVEGLSKVGKILK